MLLSSLASTCLPWKFAHHTFPVIHSTQIFLKLLTHHKVHVVVPESAESLYDEVISILNDVFIGLQQGGNLSYSYIYIWKRELYSTIIQYIILYYRELYSTVIQQYHSTVMVTGGNNMVLQNHDETPWYLYSNPRNTKGTCPICCCLIYTATSSKKKGGKDKNSLTFTQTT